MSLSSMTPFMWVVMILFMAVFMALVMFVAHVMQTNHRRRHGASSHATPDIVSVINWGIKMLLRLGVRLTILGPMMLLTVRGRKTGRPRTTPVDLHEHNGRRFLRVRGSALRQHLGVRADSALEDFVAVARSHPVFEFGSPDRPNS